MKVRTYILTGMAALVALSASCSPKKSVIERAFRDYNGKYLLYVDKGDFSLEVYDRDLERVARYRVGYGKNPDRKTKLHEGDNRTPEGAYLVNEILSMDADPESPAYRKIAAMNRVYFRARDGHHRHGKPDVDLGDNVYGPRYFGIDYPNDTDRRRYKKLVKEGIIGPGEDGELPGIGYGIAIHGNADEDSIGHPCSSGCVRMYNIDIVELDRYVQIGTPVIIVPE